MILGFDFWKKCIFELVIRGTESYENELLMKFSFSLYCTYPKAIYPFITNFNYNC